MEIDSKSALQTVVTGNVDFSIGLYKILKDKFPGNLFLSPLSVEIVLAMAYCGARGQTAQEMAAGACLPEDNAVTEAGFQELVATLKGDDNVTLEVANKLFVQSSFDLVPEFTTKMEKLFLSAVDQLDFLKNKAAAKAINNWVEKATNSKIVELIQPDMLDSLTRLVMVNAVYFKGLWEETFSEKKTKKETFYCGLQGDEERIVDMMYNTEYFMYGSSKDLGAQILEMRYKGGRFSMVVILPRERAGISALEEKLSRHTLSSLLESLVKREVRVSFPKFRVESTFDLNEPLKQMGIQTMFGDEADFTGMSEEPLVVSKVLQKAFIEVNEKGSEAAAATAARVKLMSGVLRHERPEPFIVNHPFVFFVVDTMSSAVLFLGKILYPMADLPSEETHHDH